METPICLINVNNPWQNMDHPSLLWSSGYVYAVWSSHQTKKQESLKMGFQNKSLMTIPQGLQGHGKYHPSYKKGHHGTVAHRFQDAGNRSDQLDFRID